MSARTDTSMTIRMDRKVKQEAQKIFSDLGMNLTTAINVFLRQAIYFRGFPFDVRIDIPNEETLEAIKEVQQMKENPALGKTYTDVDKMMKELLG